MTKDTPAFPVCEPHDNEPGWLRGGLTKRQWYAGQVLALAVEHNGTVEDAVTKAFQIADAMLAHEESE